jgi:ubiquinone biosynthesis protein
VNRLVIAIVAGTGVIGSALIGIFADSGPHVLGLHVFSIVGFSVSAILGLWLAWGVIRSGRL